MPRLSVQRLFDERRARLGLEWPAGRKGGARELTGEMLHRPGVGLIVVFTRTPGPLPEERRGPPARQPESTVTAAG